MTYRRNQRRRVNPYDVRRVFKKLPHTLKSFELYFLAPNGTPDGLRQYVRDLNAWLDREFGNDPHRPDPLAVMAVGGLTADGWYREMLRRDGGRRLSLVDD
jgi:hypothetical protein